MICLDRKYTGQMPEEVKKVIRENGELYRIGLHGPDIFFYYFIFKNHVSGVGYRMHKGKSQSLFIQGMSQVRETKDQALLAYLLGFGCHYLLDSACHPFVNEMHDKGRISHSLLETEFDRLLMEETGKDPYTYYPSVCIAAKERNAKRNPQGLSPCKNRGYSSEPEAYEMDYQPAGMR